ncbi:MAG: AAA family ATPase, partial [Deltaproteobacteria bacterium]|nr:AAA family ATPase [Deltaproteobacteria bacterium]
MGYPVTRGDKIQVASFGARGRFFSVQSTTPGGVVVITQHTAIRINPPDIVPERSAFRVSYEDVGGLEKELLRVREMIELPMKYPDLFAQLGIEAPKGVLLHGPPGTGKTLIARAVASEIAAHFIHINGPEIIHKYYGESEAKLREKFEEATRNAPSIIFIDEIDAIAPRRAEVVGDVEKRVVAQLLALMDGLVTRGQVVVIGATNIPEILDPALRRPGRFDREVIIGVPNRIARQAILQIHTKYMPLAPSVDLERLANITHGYVGADMEALCKEAGMVALRRILPRIQADEAYRPFETKLDIQVTMEDFLEAFKEIEPTATREFLAERPTTRFEHVGGLREVKQTLRSIIELPMTHAGLFDQIGMEPPRGILFSGPSGTGKSLLAKALAGEYQLTFISVDGPALFSKWLGES